jgi:hypothetical protein
MVVGASTEFGLNVQLNVEVGLKPEPGHVTTLLQLMVVQIVLEKVLRVSLVTMVLVQVILERCFALIIILNIRVHI